MIAAPAPPGVIRTILRGDPAYPDLLDRIPAPPPLLWVVGDVELLSRPAVAIVGARRPSPEGLLFAERLAADLAARGLVVVSGLAFGIDAAAHRGALATGTTVAVLASGADVPSPRGNAALYREVAERGAVVSEFPPGTGARAHHFLQRNRIVSGLALGAVVVEAGPRSGALITARHAADQDREVFAVPGTPLRETSAGPNALLRDGACLVRGWEDVVRELGLIVEPTRVSPSGTGGREAPQPAGRVLPHLSRAPKHLDELYAEMLASRRAAAQAVATDDLSELLAELAELELEGAVRRHAGPSFSLT